MSDEKTSTLEVIDKKILELLLNSSSRERRDIAEELGQDERMVEDRFSQLKQRGYIDLEQKTVGKINFYDAYITNKGKSLFSSPEATEEKKPFIPNWVTICIVTLIIVPTISSFLPKKLAVGSALVKTSSGMLAALYMYVHENNQRQTNLMNFIVNLSFWLLFFGLIDLFGGGLAQFLEWFLKSYAIYSLLTLSLLGMILLILRTWWIREHSSRSWNIVFVVSFFGGFLLSLCEILGYSIIEHIHSLISLADHPPDILMRPAVDQYGSLDFTDISGPIEAGIHEAEQHIESLRLLVQR